MEKDIKEFVKYLTEVSDNHGIKQEDRLDAFCDFIISLFSFVPASVAAAEETAQEMIRRTGVRWSTAYKEPALIAVVQQTLCDAWRSGT